MDWRDERYYEYDAIHTLDQWPAGVLEFFLGLGILRKLDTDAPVWLEDCEDPNWHDAEWRMDLSQGKVVGMVHCGYAWCGHYHDVEEERRQQWGPNLEGTITALTRALGIEEERIEDVPGRVWRLGSISREGRTRDMYLLKGSTWPDAPAIFAQAQRLAACANATVLCFAKTPPLDRRPSSWRTVLSLQETAMIKAGEMVLPVDRLFEDQRVASTDATIVLATQDKDILQALQEEPGQALGLADLIAAAGYGRKAIRASIDRLTKHGLVGKPPGTSRKGIAITEKGKGFLASLPPAR